MRRYWGFIGCIFSVILLGCRKDDADPRFQFLGDYDFEKHEYYYCDCPVEYQTDTTYSYVGYIAKSGEKNLEISGLGSMKFDYKSNTIGSGDVNQNSYYGAAHGYFDGDSVVHISAHDAYMGKSWGWKITGKKQN